MADGRRSAAKLLVVVAVAAALVVALLAVVPAREPRVAGAGSSAEVVGTPTSPHPALVGRAGDRRVAPGRQRPIGGALLAELRTRVAAPDPWTNAVRDSVFSNPAQARRQPHLRGPPLLRSR